MVQLAELLRLAPPDGSDAVERSSAPQGTRPPTAPARHSRLRCPGASPAAGNPVLRTTPRNAVGERLQVAVTPSPSQTGAEQIADAVRRRVRR
jgi:hypothetical protein